MRELLVVDRRRCRSIDVAADLRHLSVCRRAVSVVDFAFFRASGMLAAHHRVQDFVLKWRIGLSKLQSAHFVFSIKICASLFVRGLPPIPAFNSLRADLPRRIAAIMDEHDFGAFIELTETVLELDMIFRSNAQSQNCPPRVPNAPTSSATPLPPLPSTVPESSSHASKKEQICNNCKSRGLRAVGHTDGTCFQPGGGMEGHHEEYLSNKGHIHAMLAECLENTLLSLEPPALPPDSFLPLDSPIFSPASDNEVFVPPIAHLSVASYIPNSDVCEDVYTQSDLKLLPRLTSQVQHSYHSLISIMRSWIPVALTILFVTGLYFAIILNNLCLSEQPIADLWKH